MSALFDLVTSGATHLDAAIAYVTNSGVDTVLGYGDAHGARSAWRAIDKRFLVSIDWFRSEPTALERLAGLPAAVRVHDGSRVASRKGCIPYLPWHPKWFGARGPGVRGQLVGSGNLSRNGLVAGHEAGLLQIVKNPTNRAERDVDASIRDAEGWFDRIWQSASDLNLVIDKYRAGYAVQPKDNTGRNDDSADASGRVGTRYGLRPEQLAALTTATNLWIEGGELTHNRGRNRPGNQLMMSALMRVFFGAPADAVPRNTHVGSAVIEHWNDQSIVATASIRFSDNSMDVITLPVTEPPWPSTYDNRVILFTKVSRGNDLRFVMSVRTVTGARALRASSASAGTSYVMRSGRRWGVFG